MLNLNHLNIDLDKARREHFEFYKCFITKKLTGSNCKSTSPDGSHPNRPGFCKGYRKKTFKYKNQQSLLIKFLITESRLDDLILAPPDKLENINNEFIQRFNSHFGTGVYDSYIKLESGDRARFRPKKVHQFFLDLNKVIDYDELGDDKDYNSYTLTNNLGVRSCIYCNRTHIITQRKRKDKKDGRLMSPQLDHWFPQSQYPLLQISFHNLIPSCDICNSRVKNRTVFRLLDHFHPYQVNDASISFSYRYSVLNQKYQIYFKDPSNSEILRTCKDMFIDQMYDGHGEELHDLITLEREYSKDYLTSLRNAFPNIRLTDELIYRLAFGTELNKENFHKRPMSKFKNDILKELGIIS